MNTAKQAKDIMNNVVNILSDTCTRYFNSSSEENTNSTILRKEIESLCGPQHSDGFYYFYDEYNGLHSIEITNNEIIVREMPTTFEFIYDEEALFEN